ncbi:MAG: iron chelate uptake ABC transporter family permease subunit [Pedobacter sp.]|nr:iron chelate uptake ABC transporter family permease subunit [Pedobacter sp.]
MSTFELFWPALAGGLLVALVAGPLGSLLVWRRLAWFGDSLAHAALLGVGLSLLLSIPGWAGIAGVCLVVALLLGVLLQHPELASDTLLTILSTTSLSLGLIAVSLSDVRVDLMAYLFGDLLSMEASDLPWLFAGTILLLGLLGWQWRNLLLASINEEMAEVDGVAVGRLRLLLLILLALVVTAAMKVVGVLLITALLVIPAAAARRLSRTPEQMAVLASLTGMLAVCAGLGSSLQWDIPLGPAIVVAAAAAFLLSRLPRMSS